ncbi:hypothetical protein G9A89_000935 [Geosiphon pyriformis]|nr:hypothetical protein G9A89_000935 [Geosiphon pyriformis]
MENFSQNGFEISSLKPPFPPRITSEELFSNAVTKLKETGEIQKTPNAFFVYSKVFRNHIKTNTNFSKMPIQSKIVARLWKQEPDYVKLKYKQLANEAKNQFRKYSESSHPLQNIFHYVPPRPAVNNVTSENSHSQENISTSIEPIQNPVSIQTSPLVQPNEILPQTNQINTPYLYFLYEPLYLQFISNQHPYFTFYTSSNAPEPDQNQPEGFEPFS